MALASHSSKYMNSYQLCSGLSSPFLSLENNTVSGHFLEKVIKKKKKEEGQREGEAGASCDPGVREERSERRGQEREGRNVLEHSLPHARPSRVPCRGAAGVISEDEDAVEWGPGFGPWEPGGPVRRRVGRLRGQPPAQVRRRALGPASVLGEPGRTAACSPQPGALGICPSTNTVSRGSPGAWQPEAATPQPQGVFRFAGKRRLGPRCVYPPLSSY